MILPILPAGRTSAPRRCAPPWIRYHAASLLQIFFLYDIFIMILHMHIFFWPSYPARQHNGVDIYGILQSIYIYTTAHTSRRCDAGGRGDSRFLPDCPVLISFLYRDLQEIYIYIYIYISFFIRSLLSGCTVIVVDDALIRALASLSSIQSFLVLFL
jgi:hypothetical protein